MLGQAFDFSDEIFCFAQLKLSLKGSAIFKIILFLISDQTENLLNDSWGKSGYKKTHLSVKGGKVAL